MVNCELGSVKKVLETLTKEPSMYKGGQICNVIRLSLGLGLVTVYGIHVG